MAGFPKGVTVKVSKEHAMYPPAGTEGKVLFSGNPYGKGHRTLIKMGDGKEQWFRTDHLELARNPVPNTKEESVFRIKVSELRKVIREAIQETGAYYGKMMPARGAVMGGNGQKNPEDVCPCGDPVCTGCDMNEASDDLCRHCKKNVGSEHPDYSSPICDSCVDRLEREDRVERDEYADFYDSLAPSKRWRHPRP